MRCVHQSRWLEYRAPFGALPLGTSVTLSMDAFECNPFEIAVYLRTWIDGVGEKRYRCEQDSEHAHRFSVTLTPDTPALLWYRFVIDSPEGCFTLGAAQGCVGGTGVMSNNPEAPSFQITVYEPRTIRPSWYEGGVVYQIFPDRYRRDAAWRERCQEVLAQPHAGIPRQLVEAWDEPPVYERNPNGSIKHWDFYGGSLKGIEEDLSRLAKLGITAIYLNPIFEAASNHRYDTADYLAIDPMLGTKEDFSSLCATAQNLGISIILDGVFNHTGDDSRYFNRFGNYPDAGAWHDVHSPWRRAFHFHDDGSYDAWWGIGNMPALNEASPEVQELILGDDGVVRYWLRAGASGWRLDVADELSDEFLAGIRRAACTEKPDALVLGEVWEDASNKVSYGMLKRYLLGTELDSAMNYPVRDVIIGFLRGWMSAELAAETLESLRENYPPEALCCALNLLSSHDRPRILSVLGEAPDEAQLPEYERGRFRLDTDGMELGLARLRLACLMQMLLPGVPSIYYGDEFGLEGLTDPGNRRTLPDAASITDMRAHAAHTQALRLRQGYEVCRTGGWYSWAAAQDVLAFERTSAKEHMTVLINRHRSETRALSCQFVGPQVEDLLSGRIYSLGQDARVSLNLEPLSAMVLYGVRSH
ncbi:glycoside hydrolase family 13 protein [Collinsella sp. zg1085]|uniref:glycoside hydrolase family 13 protein n=1 Tax=Collinsella sp. zg1085 TaxID=2844380 RepID=UPI001C0D8687|nr:glycoside hydrolase family 13 protein [Collinsella sp. zg1085]QWT17141.1 glycoside hydrolase family 13 protein [Collinsella sp. zg1085]